MSLIKQEYQEEIAKLMECFDDTEKKVKHLEQDTFELAIPSINQLRYVSYHILKAASTDLNSDDIKDEVTKALNHCQRAKFDAIEIWITYLLEEIRIFEETYSPIKETQSVIVDYLECLSKAQVASDVLSSIADKEKKREEYYKKITPHYDKLKIIANKFNKSKPLIATLVSENNDQKKKDSRRFAIQIALTVFGSIIALMILGSKLGYISNSENSSTESESHVTQ